MWLGVEVAVKESLEVEGVVEIGEEVEGAVIEEVEGVEN